MNNLNLDNESLSNFNADPTNYVLYQHKSTLYAEKKGLSSRLKRIFFVWRNYNFKAIIRNLSQSNAVNFNSEDKDKFEDKFINNLIVKVNRYLDKHKYNKGKKLDSIQETFRNITSTQGKPVTPLSTPSLISTHPSASINSGREKTKEPPKSEQETPVPLSPAQDSGGNIHHPQKSIGDSQPPPKNSSEQEDLGGPILETSLSSIPVERMGEVAASSQSKTLTLDNSKLLIAAQQSARRFKSSELMQNGIISSDYPKIIEQFRLFFKDKSLEELELYYSAEGVSNQIQLLGTECSKHFNKSSLSFSGQDSLNRELLTSTNWNAALQSPEVLLGLFALEAAALKGATDAKNLITPYGERTIPGMLDFCLKNQHPVLLEALPLNKQIYADEQLSHVREYLDRKDIEKTFLPILQAFEGAYKILYEGKEPPKSSFQSIFDISYEPHKWSDYKKIVEMLVSAMEKESESKLFTLQAAQYTPDHLKDQTTFGFKELLSRKGLDSKTMTLEEVVQVIVESHELLDHQVSHLFYDRLHLLVALKSTDVKVRLKDRIVSMREIILGIVNKFANEGVTDKTAIAAEQFYLRFMLIAEKFIEDKRIGRDEVQTILGTPPFKTFSPPDFLELENTLDQNPEDLHLLNTLANLYKNKGNYTAALALFQRIQKIGSEQGLWLENLSSEQCEKNIIKCRENIGIQKKRLLNHISENEIGPEVSACINNAFRGRIKHHLLTPLEAAAIRVYTFPYYKIINAILNQNQEQIKQELSKCPEDKQQAFLEFFEELIPIIKHGIEKLALDESTQASNDIQQSLVFRGMGVPMEQIKKWQEMQEKKEPICNRAFYSTSKIAEKALIFAKREGIEKNKQGVIFVICSQTGASIEKLSIASEEKEVLFTPNRVFEILEIKEWTRQNPTAFPNEQLQKQLPQDFPNLWVVKLKEKSVH